MPTRPPHSAADGKSGNRVVLVLEEVDVARLHEEMSQIRAILAELAVQLTAISRGTIGDGPLHHTDDGDYLLTLLQCAGLVQRSKSTLLKYEGHRVHPLPEPEIRGKGGYASEYRWSQMRPWLEKVFHRKLGEVPLCSRRRRI